ncbi:hypothetical protein D3OALGA1CA_1639 [Olavius algarvensis associated proteobacterium Delta 3]|nr:hypothetical protein D3OALGB2SA_1609 [Olavius algarvensis associated proteobacterium Delta 3]CAB5104482.1 hypothetical protein D3OALGA1CA_1639 [Olavius algarvensis associated proteobacterium Delta 3]
MHPEELPTVWIEADQDCKNYLSIRILKKEFSCKAFFPRLGKYL